MDLLFLALIAVFVAAIAALAFACDALGRKS